MAVLYPAGVDFCVEYVACLGVAQQEALDASTDRLVTYVLLDFTAILGENRALVEGELFPGAEIAAKEREHSVEYGPNFVNLVGLVNSLVCLIDQVQEAPEGDEAVVLHDFPETGGVRDKVVVGPFPVALIPQFVHAPLNLKPQAEDCLQLWDTDRLEILGIV